MAKLTIASVTAQNEELRATLKIATEQTEAEHTKRYAAERRSDELQKKVDQAVQGVIDARLEAERYKGMIEMLERLGTIPKPVSDDRY